MFDLDNPKISVVLPVYNGERYIQSAIDSIISQSFSNWELIIVDDCSTDMTQYLVKKYLGKDKRIIYIRNSDNQKLPKSLNIGFEKAKGEYFTWTSDDNCYRSDALKRMSDILDSNSDVAMVYARMMNIDENGNQICLQREAPFEELFIKNIIGACFMYRRSVWEVIGNYDIELFGVEDYDYWLRITKNNKILQISDILYDYRRHKDSLTSTKSDFINKQLLILKKKHINWIVERYQMNRNMVCRLFCNCIDIIEQNTLVEQNFQKFFPFLRLYKRDIEGDPVIIFGAGELGKKALKKLKGQAIAFVDNDLKKVGTFIEKIPVLSFGEAAIREEPIVIAVSKNHMHEVLLQLADHQIEKPFYIYPYFNKN